MFRSEGLRVKMIAAAALLAALGLALMVGPAVNTVSADTATITDADGTPIPDAGGPYLTGIKDNGQRLPITLDGSGSSTSCDSAAYDWDTDNDAMYGAEDTGGANAFIGGQPLAGSDVTGEEVSGYENGNWVEGVTYNVALRVTGCSGEQAVDTAQVFIRQDPPPTVDAGPDTSGLEGAPVALDGRATDPEGDSLTTRWSFENAGADDCAISDPTALDTSVVCNVPGSYTVALTVDDGCSNCSVRLVKDTATLTVEADNTPPTVSVTTTKKRNANATVQFSEPMDPSTLMQDATNPVSQPSTSQTIVLLKGASTSTTVVPAKVSCTDPTCKTVILDPDVRLGKRKQYTVKVEGAADTDGLAVEDLAGNELVQDSLKTFRTGAR